MKNSPIQIVLNSSDYVTIWERQGGGANRDFYEGRDVDFRNHVNLIEEQLSTIESFQNKNANKVSYAKVKLKSNALAKSHRPTTKLFKKDIAPIVGAGSLGELLVELSESSISILKSKLSTCELETNYQIKNNKRVATPSRLRSEIGAIDYIQLYDKSDKRDFSIQEAINWFQNEQTGGLYLIELFETPISESKWDTLIEDKFLLFDSFKKILINFEGGLIFSKILISEFMSPLFELKLTMDNEKIISFNRSIKDRKKIKNLKVSEHKKIIELLENHPLVKKISLPPIIEKHSVKSSSDGSKIEIPVFEENKKYPKIAVVDGGVSTKIGDWLLHSHGYLAEDDKDTSHGTFIAGLNILGKELNGLEVCSEEDGCQIIDLDILPNKNFNDYYSDITDLFDELNNAVSEIKSITGARVFNFSLNIREHSSTENYSYAAKMLDTIAEVNDIIFIISAGNIDTGILRNEWSNNHIDNLTSLASFTNDTIKQPGESTRNFSVSALNPPGSSKLIPYALSNYSCRGPGSICGIKPDFAHIGGFGSLDPILGRGLYSITPDLEKTDGCGTSYAAPLVAKTLATLDSKIEGYTSRETLSALLIHHSTRPQLYQETNIKKISKDLIGYGIPSNAESMLEGDENSITLVFANRIFQSKKLSFNFSWPDCLIKNGKCYGKAKLTIVSTPELDYNYGTEFIRHNIDAYLRQADEDGKYIGRLEPLFSNNSISSLFEKDLITHAMKWSPVKVYEKEFKRGIGKTSDWRIDIEYLSREGIVIPAEGIPFTAILTISDPTKQEPVFQQMHLSLGSLGVKTSNIQTAARITNRV